MGPSIGARAPKAANPAEVGRETDAQGWAAGGAAEAAGGGL